MKPRFSLLAAAVLSLSFCAPARATTTLYRFCSDSSDNSQVADNIAASETAGWTISGKGSTTTGVGSGTYSYPMRVNTATTATSPEVPTGTHIVSATIGGRTSNTDGMFVVTPQFADGTTGTAINAALSETGSLLEIPVSFRGGNDVASFSIARSGDGTMYLYYVKIESLVVLSSPDNLACDGDPGENGFSVGWDTVTDAEGYSVKLVGPNNSIVSSNDIVTTSATFSGLVPSTQYSVVVVALGDYDTTDDSPASTIQVTTADSAVAAPTLVVANTSSWTAGAAGTSAVSATLEGNVACTVESVTMSDGSTATVAGGVLSWTPPLSSVAATITATFYVTHGSDTWYLSEDLSVAATPAPGAPSVTLSGATPRSFNASWSAPAGGPIVSYKVRAWTGRATPDNPTGNTNEYFAAYRTGGSIPADWSASASLSSAYASDPAPVKFDKNIALVSHVYPRHLTSLSFVVKQNGTATGSTFSVYGSSGEANAEYELIQSYDATTFSKGDAGTTQTLSVPAGVHQFKFEYERSSGNVGFGSFEVSGTNWPAADFLKGWGGAKTDVGLATAQTISNPVAGQTNYVEVTAVGPTGLSTSTIASVAVPGRPSVISVH